VTVPTVAMFMPIVVVVGRCVVMCVAHEGDFAVLKEDGSTG